MKKKILILGATGFIGRNLAAYYAKDDRYEVYGSFFRSRPLEDARIRMVQADLTRREDVERVLTGMDVVLQAAAITTGSKDVVATPYIHITDNAIMNSLIFRCAFEQSIAHLVFLSCSVMYHDGETPLKEEDFDANREMFPSYFGAGWNKVYLEKMCEFYSRLGRNKFTAIRHSNCYGPYDKYDLERSHVLGATVAKVMGAKDGKLTVWGSGEEKRDLLHIDDLVRLTEHILERQQNPFGLYNAGSGDPVSIRELVERVIRASGRDLWVENDPGQPTMKISITLDSSKAKRELGWQPQIGLDEGLAALIPWYRKTYPERCSES
jgi:GDP-L-fucose synthase